MAAGARPVHRVCFIELSLTVVMIVVMATGLIQFAAWPTLFLSGVAGVSLAALDFFIGDWQPAASQIASATINGILAGCAFALQPCSVLWFNNIVGLLKLLAAWTAGCACVSLLGAKWPSFILLLAGNVLVVAAAAIVGAWQRKMRRPKQLHTNAMPGLPSSLVDSLLSLVCLPVQRF